MNITIDEHPSLRQILAVIPAPAGFGGRVRFSLGDDEASSAFKLHPRTGVLKARQPELIDYEQQDNFQITVLVTGKGGRREQVKITIKLTDVLEMNEDKIIQKADAVNGYQLGKVTAGGDTAVWQVFEGRSRTESAKFKIVDGQLTVTSQTPLTGGKYELRLVDQLSGKTYDVSIDVNDITPPPPQVVNFQPKKDHRPIFFTCHRIGI